MGENGEKTGSKLQLDSKKQCVPSITCFTPDDTGRQIRDFMASHQGTFLLVQSLYKLPFGLFWYPLLCKHPVNLLDLISLDF